MRTIESFGPDPRQAALKISQGGSPVLPLDGDRTQVEQHKRIVWPLGQLGFEDLVIALQLPLSQRRVGIAGVPDCDIGPPHWHVRPPQCRQDLLVHRDSSSARPRAVERAGYDRRPSARHPHSAPDRKSSARRKPPHLPCLARASPRWSDLHHQSPQVNTPHLAKGGLGGSAWATQRLRRALPSSTPSQSVQQLPQLLPLRRVNDIIGIEPERIVTGGPRQRRVAGRGEVIDPDEIKHPSPELAGNLPRTVL